MVERAAALFLSIPYLHANVQTKENNTLAASIQTSLPCFYDESNFMTWINAHHKP